VSDCGVISVSTVDAETPRWNSQQTGQYEATDLIRSQKQPLVSHYLVSALRSLLMCVMVVVSHRSMSSKRPGDMGR
jgi:hypothetical protein